MAGGTAPLASRPRRQGQGAGARQCVQKGRNPSWPGEGWRVGRGPAKARQRAGSKQECHQGWVRRLLAAGVASLRGGGKQTGPSARRTTPQGGRGDGPASAVGAARGKSSLPGRDPGQFRPATSSIPQRGRREVGGASRAGTRGAPGARSFLLVKQSLGAPPGAPRASGRGAAGGGHCSAPLCSGFPPSRPAAEGEPDLADVLALAGLSGPSLFPLRG